MRNVGYKRNCRCGDARVCTLGCLSRLSTLNNHTWLSLVPRPLSQISGRVSDFSERGLGTRLDLSVITLASILILKVLLVAF